jgi:hypothetical protein
VTLLSVLRDLVGAAAAPADPPGARRIIVAVELKSRHVVVGAPTPGDRQALAGLHVPDLVAAAERIDVPRARRIVVAVELKSLHVVVSAPTPSDREAFAGLGVDELHAG